MSRMTKIVWCLVVLGLAIDCRAQAAQSPADLAKLAGWAGVSPNSSEAFTFVIMSDRTGNAAEGEWDAAVVEVNRLKPDFVICVGDLVEGGNDNPAVIARQWDEMDAVIRKFDAPFFYCPGNHDVSGTGQLDEYVKRHGINGKSYYSFDYRGYHFVVLDSTTAMRRAAQTEEQLTWLKQDLETARDARHVFLFYHHPNFEDNDKVWPRVRAMLDEKKTSIFNGHWHTLNYSVEEGIPTYVLAGTGAKLRQREDRESGEFRMFAHVKVDQGTPTVAMIPIHGVLPPNYVVRPFVNDLTQLEESLTGMAVSQEGGTVHVTQRNSLDRSVQMRLGVEGDGWTSQPAKAELTIPAGGRSSTDLKLATTRPGTSRPTLVAQYTLDNRQGQTVTVDMNGELDVYSSARIARISGVTIDGKLDDWNSIQPVIVDSPMSVYRDREHWSGPADLSYKARIGHDEKNLYVAVEVKDDHVSSVGPSANKTDGVEFYFDVRPTDQRTSSHSDGTGWVIMPVPAQDKAPAPVWRVGKRKAPQGMVVAYHQVEGGYVYEFSVPLVELGMTGSIDPGRPMAWDVLINDPDPGEEMVKRMTTTGNGNNGKYTGGFVRSTLE